jgi:hypothetical protein
MQHKLTDFPASKKNIGSSVISTAQGRFYNLLLSLVSCFSSFLLALKKSNKMTNLYNL